MRSVEGAIVLITGAARGMGKLYAERALAENASAIVLWDADEAALRETAAELGPTAHPFVVNLADPIAIAATAEEVRAEIGDPDVLFNNAGIVRGKPFAEHSHDDIALTMAVNAQAPMHVTREFLPAMLEKVGECRIVNIASAAGLLSNPRMSVYSASKWAVVGWSDSLRLELRNTTVRVSTICPSYVRTGMFDGVTPPKFTGLLSPRRVVATVWTAMLIGKPMVMLPAAVPISKVLRGILPLRLWDSVATRFGIYSSMDTFTGRPQ
jgi:NAD(P)-dependent dehydrogenase (short-subunit alcohol dehydrogenase family)